MQISVIWFSILSDLSVNLAAGWTGAIIILPNFSTKKGLERFLILTNDILWIILFLLLAFIFKSIL